MHTIYYLENVKKFGKKKLLWKKNETKKLNSHRKFECRSAIFNFKQVYYSVVDTLTDGQMKSRGYSPYLLHTNENELQVS
jgi:hypothetical protein